MQNACRRVVMLSNSNEFYLKIKSVVSHYYTEVLRRKNVWNKALKYLNDFFFGKKEIADTKRYRKDQIRK